MNILKKARNPYGIYGCERGFIMQKFVRLRKKAQVTIPTEIVELLHLNEGDNLNIQVEDGRIVLIPVT